jgi:hypothetical protein
VVVVFAVVLLLVFMVCCCCIGIGGVSHRGQYGGCQIGRPAVWEINGYHHLVVALLHDQPRGEKDLWRIKKIFELPANVTVSGLVLHSFPNNIYCALSNLVTLYDNELIFWRK